MWQKVKRNVEWTVVEENIDEASLEKVVGLFIVRAA